MAELITDLDIIENKILWGSDSSKKSIVLCTRMLKLCSGYEKPYWRWTQLLLEKGQIQKAKQKFNPLTGNISG